MANENNLKKLNDMPPEEARAIRSKGGKKSGETRRRKKAFREYAQMILNLKPRKQKKLLKKWDDLGYDAEADGYPTVAERIAMRLATRALENDDDAALRMLMSYSHNPTMAEQIDLERVKAMAEGRAKLDVTLSREDGAVMDEIRTRLEREAGPDDGGAGGGVPIPDPTPG